MVTGEIGEGVDMVTETSSVTQTSTETITVRHMLLPLSLHLFFQLLIYHQFLTTHRWACHPLKNILNIILQGTKSLFVTSTPSLGHRRKLGLRVRHFHSPLGMGCQEVFRQIISSPTSVLLGKPSQCHLLIGHSL